jgi:hypothetical protein
MHASNKALTLDIGFTSVMNARECSMNVDILGRGVSGVPLIAVQFCFSPEPP